MIKFDQSEYEYNQIQQIFLSQQMNWRERTNYIQSRIEHREESSFVTVLTVYYQEPNEFVYPVGNVELILGEPGQRVIHSSEFIKLLPHCLWIFRVLGKGEYLFSVDGGSRCSIPVEYLIKVRKEKIDHWFLVD